MSDPDRLYWDDRVTEGRAALARRDGAQWELGDLALTVQTTYGEADFQRYAREVGVEYDTMRDYRRVSAAFEVGDRSPNLSWTHHRLLAGREDRLAWLLRAGTDSWSLRVLREALAEEAAGQHEPAAALEVESETVRRLRAEQARGGAKTGKKFREVPTFDSRFKDQVRQLRMSFEPMYDVEREYLPVETIREHAHELQEIVNELLGMIEEATG